MQEFPENLMSRISNNIPLFPYRMNIPRLPPLQIPDSPKLSPRSPRQLASPRIFLSPRQLQSSRTELPKISPRAVFQPEQDSPRDNGILNQFLDKMESKRMLSREESQFADSSTQFLSEKKRSIYTLKPAEKQVLISKFPTSNKKHVTALDLHHLARETIE